MADFGGELDVFRTETRAWLEANCPASMRTPLTGDETPWGGRKFKWKNPDSKVWLDRMAEKGWTAPMWPREYGGGGLSAAEARVLEQELARIKARPALFSFGIWMLGPVLLEYATEEQKKEHLPKIVRGEIRWCQGYSEPGAGSDLAGLQTRCEDKGDHFLINGQKIWTSGAQYADMCFCLVRTDTSKKHEGISFVLIDMHQPGVEVRPIKLINGTSPFCETFFTDARAEKKNLVGPLNGGWTIGKRLLQHERSGLSGGGGGFGMGRSLENLAKEYVGTDEAGRISDSDLRTRIIQNDMDWRAFQQTAMRAMAEAKGNSGPSAATSIMKNAATSTLQTRAELTLEIMGSQGLGWEGDQFSREEKEAVRSWLGGKATTIYGGSQEVQSNIISKRILGLPDLTQNH